ncbi:apolipoprotein D-like [Mytilus edulis]|uniref:Apolipoprotein D n=1 Tax=Mytilus edulis TaxID=6550 RepID=A0A8S3TAR8_MYTED|nr:APOD [Mytilus edulis]
MFTVALFVLCFILNVGVTHAQIVGIGKCPPVVAQKELDVKEYLGDWYEIYKFKANFEDGQECIKANYLLKEDKHIRVQNEGKTPNGETISIVGDGYAPDENEPAKLLVKFSEAAPYGNYWVIDTDYKTYTLIYSCSEVVDVHFEFAWILAREKSITAEIKTKLFQELEDFKVDTKNFMKTDQTASYCEDK